MLRLILISLVALSPGRAGGEFSTNEEALAKRALTQLYSHFDAEEYRFELHTRWIPGSLLEANPSKVMSLQLIGEAGRYATFQVIYQQANSIEEVQIQFRVDAWQKVQVATERIGNGEIITPEMLKEQWVEITLGRDRFATSVDQLIGKATRRFTNAGQPFRLHEISEPLAIKAGDTIQMIYSNGGIELALTCESRQSGAQEDAVVVYCPETRKKYEAQVLKPGEVEWLRTM